MKMSDFSKAIKYGTDDYVRTQLYNFNFGKFDNLSRPIRERIMNIICSEMDARNLW